MQQLALVFTHPTVVGVLAQIEVVVRDSIAIVIVAVAILDAAVVGSAHERSALAIQSRQHFNAPDVEPSRLLLLVHASARPRRQPLDTRPRQRLDHLPVAATTMFAAVLVALAVTIGCDCAHRTAGRSLHEINPG